VVGRDHQRNGLVGDRVAREGKGCSFVEAEMERRYSVARGNGVWCDREDPLTRKLPKTAGETEGSTDRRRAKQK
jgi:hypothetical protein